MITELIAELPSESAYLELLERFDKLLKKYSRKLSLEDSYEELRLFFFEIVNKMNRQNLCCHSDGQAVNYIALSIKITTLPYQQKINVKPIRVFQI